MTSIETIALLQEIGDSPTNVIIMIMTLFTLGKLKPFIEWYKNLNLEKKKNLEKATTCNQLSDKEKQFLCELKAKDVFAEATGFHGDRRTRELAIDCIEKSCGKITIKHFKRMEKYIQYTEQQLQINITKIEWVWQSAMYMITICLFLITPPIVFYSILITAVDDKINSKTLVIPIILIILTILYTPELILYQTLNTFYKNNRSFFIQKKPKKIYMIALPIILFIIFTIILYHINIYILF